MPRDRWSCLAKRHERNPADKPLNTFPVELLHAICELLKLPELKSFRLVCKLFAQIGGDYLLKELHLIYTRASFERLVKISESPLSNRVTSLLFEGDRLVEIDSFRTWYKLRSYQSTHENVVAMHDEMKDIVIQDERALRKFRRYAMKSRMERHQVSESELERAFATYKAYCKDQEILEGWNIDLQSLVKCFQSCPNIEQVTMTTAGQIRPRTKMLRSAHANAHITVEKDNHELSGVQQLRTILLAAARTNTQLKHLAVGGISPAVFEDDDAKEMMSAMKCLKSFWLVIESCLDGWDYSADTVRRDLYLDYFESGCLVEFIRNAKDLRVLRICFPGDTEFGSCLSLDRIFANEILKDLRWLWLKGVSSTPREFVDFFLRHSQTLRYIRLEDMCLSEGTWKEVFEALSQKLPLVRRFEFRGLLCSWDSDELWKFGKYDHASVKPHIGTRALCNYLRKGGVFPNTEAEIALHVPGPTHDDGEPGPDVDGYIDYPDDDVGWQEMMEEGPGDWTKYWV